MGPLSTPQADHTSQVLRSRVEQTTRLPEVRTGLRRACRLPRPRPSSGVFRVPAAPPGCIRSCIVLRSSELRFVVGHLLGSTSAWIWRRSCSSSCRPVPLPPRLDTLPRSPGRCRSAHTGRYLLRSGGCAAPPGRTSFPRAGSPASWGSMIELGRPYSGGVACRRLAVLQNRLGQCARRRPSPNPPHGGRRHARIVANQVPERVYSAVRTENRCPRPTGQAWRAPFRTR